MPGQPGQPNQPGMPPGHPAAPPQLPAGHPAMPGENPELVLSPDWPIGKPEDMFDDPHLLASGGLADVKLPDGRQSRLPVIPIEMDGQRPGRGGDLARVGQHTADVLRDLGIADAEIVALSATGVVAGEPG